MSDMKTIPSGFTVPTKSGGGQPGIYIQAVGKESEASPGAWGYARIWEDPAGKWHDIFRHSGWEVDNVSQKERLRRAYDAAHAENTSDGLGVFGNADPKGVRLQESAAALNNPPFDELKNRLEALNSNQDFSKGSNDGTTAERLIWSLVGKQDSEFEFQNQEGYDIECPQGCFHEVKSFQGNAEIHFSSAQLSKMNDQNYFVWLVKKDGTSIGDWQIYKLKGTEVFAAIKHLAKSKFELTDNGERQDVHLAVGVKFKLPGNGDGSGITVHANGNGNGDKPSVTLADVVLQDGKPYPLTACEWYESVQMGNGNPRKWWVNADEQ